MASSDKQSSKKSKSGPKDDILQQQDVRQAVVIAETFNDEFAPLTTEKPSSLFPLVNKCLIDYALEALQKSGIQEVFVFCSIHSQLVKNHIREKWSSEVEGSMVVSVISSESFMSVGDVLRELDSKALIRSDFVLVNGHVVNTLDLSRILEEHKKVRKVDKGCAITLICRKVSPQHRTRNKTTDVLMAVASDTKKIRFYQKRGNRKSLTIPLEVFQENDEVTIHYDVLDCNVCICSPSVPPLYSDNFDYQTFDDLLRGLIINEEVLCSSMYLHVVENGYGVGINNLIMYDFVSQDIVQRWSYPVVPDLFTQNSSSYVHLRGNIYKDNVDLHRNCILQKNVVLGKGTMVGENTHIDSSVIGHNCRIGSNVTMKGCYLWDNVVIGDNCELEMCLLGDSVVLKANVKVPAGCVLSSRVVIGDYVTLQQLTRLQFEPPDNDDGFGEEKVPDISESIPACDPFYVGVNGRGYLYVEANDSDDDEDNEKNKKLIWGKPVVLPSPDEESDTDSEEEDAAFEPQYEDESPVGEEEEEDTMLFYNEVLDSLQRAIEEKIKSDNVILEINSSKYAYNITVKEVNSLVTKAILSIPHQENKSSESSAQEYFLRLRPILVSFLPLIRNYIKNASSQMDCLQAIEEFMKNNQDLLPILMKILHVLYDKEVLNENVIFKWHGAMTAESKSVKKQVAPFIKWLKEADEESSED